MVQKIMPCLGIQCKVGSSCCIWGNEHLEQVVTTPLDDVPDMVKLIHCSIFTLIFHCTPTQQGHSISCGEGKLNIVARIIKSTTKISLN